MSAMRLLLFVLIASISVGGCMPRNETAGTNPAPSETVTVLPTLLPVPTLTEVQQAFPLAVPGPYPVGMRSYSFGTLFNGDRSVSITLWYPRVDLSDLGSNRVVGDVEPNPEGAPYPLILGSRKSGRDFGQHLASYGFIWLGIDGQDSADAWGNWLIDYPLMILFALDQISQEVPAGMEGIIDNQHSGAAGYSFDGYNALALSGARVDPDYYLNQCGSVNDMDDPPAAWWVDYICAPSKDWASFMGHAGADLTTSGDGLWQPMTDPRIRAVMPMAPEGAWLFGERGLAAVDRPVLILHGTSDVLNYYQLEGVPIFERMGTVDKTLISFRGQGHFMIFDPENLYRMRHFAVAFFTRWLKDDYRYDRYLSEEFIQAFDDLAWGVYTP